MSQKYNIVNVRNFYPNLANFKFIAHFLGQRKEFNLFSDWPQFLELHVSETIGQNPEVHVTLF